ncbi:hypothetical protein UlMin_003316 [Ulmus minor]
MECELCGLLARINCESDQASLCWDCDEKVHGANFLVAKHSRTLLCHVCHSPTPWKASGSKLSPTVSVCETCVDLHGRKLEPARDRDDEEFEEEDDDEVEMFSSDEEDEEFEVEEEEGENQVVPLAFSDSSSPPAGSSSGSEEERLSTTKRSRENADLDSDDESTTESIRTLKRSRPSKEGQSESRSSSIISSVLKLQNEAITDVNQASATILGICKLSRDESR